MDAAANLATIAAYVNRAESRDWDAFEELLDHEVVYELPQTRERVRGRSELRRFTAEYPGDWHLELAESYADAQGGVARLDSRMGVGQTDTAIVFFRFDADGLITHVTDWWPEPYEPPPGRDHLADRY
jgi:hypothetical protein